MPAYFKDQILPSSESLTLITHYCISTLFDNSLTKGIIKEI